MKIKLFLSGLVLLTFISNAQSQRNLINVGLPYQQEKSVKLDVIIK